MSSLQSSEDVALPRQTWMFERIGWAVLGLIVLGALLGLFGSGPLSRATATAPSGAFSADYSRFARMQSPVSLTMRFEAPSGQREARVWIDQAFLSSIDLRRITPEPDSVELGAGRVTFVFPLGTGGGEQTVKIQFEATGPGSVDSRIGLDDGGEVSISQFFYP